MLRSLGYDLQEVPPDAEVELQWSYFPGSWGVFVLLAVVAAAIYGVFWLYRREMETASLVAKRFLAVLRALVVLVLVFVFLGPALVTVQTKQLHPEIKLLRDSSLSMNTADRYRDDKQAEEVATLLHMTRDQLRAKPVSRAAILQTAFEKNDSALLKAVTEKGRLQAYDFAENVQKVEQLSAVAPDETDKNQDPPAADKSTDPAVAAKESKDKKALPPPRLPPWTADGRTTDIAQAIRTALEGETPAAIILATEGQHTGRDDVKEAAREARERGVPLLVIGVGDPTRQTNLKVASVYVRPQVWQDEPFEIDAMIVAEGDQERTFRVDLLEQRINETDGSTNAGVAVQTISLSAPAGGGRLRAEFSHTAREAGKYVYSVKVEAIENELSEEDNQLPSAPVTVLSREKVRVLLVAGSPSWDFRLVQKLLARDKTITVSCWLQTLDEERAQEGTRVITHLPVTKEELFWYDVILLFDPDPKEFDQSWMELLKQFAGEHAGGVLFMAGPKHAGTFLTSARTSGIRDVLPVRFGDVGELELRNLLTTSTRAWPMRMVAPNSDHPVLSFYPDRQETLKRWETLPGIFWSFPAQEPKPTALVLAEHGDPTLRTVEAARPLLVAGRYGAGQTVYLGFNGSWRWRKAGRQAEFFDKFWIQTVRFLVEGRSLEGRRRGYVQTEKDRYEIGERIVVTARLQDASYNPLEQPKIDAVLQTADGPEPLPLLPVANRPGVFESTFIAKKTGVQSVKLALPAGPDGEVPYLESQFSVELPSVETSEVWLDKPLLIDLATTSGGKYFDLHELDQLAAAIPYKTQVIEIRSRPRPLWDVSAVLVALVGLLSLEWFVRKRCKLL